MFLVSSNKRYASPNYEPFLIHMRALFPKYPMYLLVDASNEAKKIEIFNDHQLSFAARIVSLWHTRESETERMEREAAARMAESSSEEDEPMNAADDMNEDFWEQVGCVREYGDDWFDL